MDNDAWLGRDANEWMRAMADGYVRAQIVFALHETGVWTALREHGPQTTEELAARCSIDGHLLDGVLHFFAFSDDTVAKTGDKFALTERGDWLFSDTCRAYATGLIGAYGCLMENLLPALRGQKKYGVDFERDGGRLAVGSYLAGKHTYPWIVAEIDRLGQRVVADLGCGSADVLMSLCELGPGLSGVGVDISPGVLGEARRRIDARNFASRIRLVQADLTDPASYVRELADVQVFHALMVFHEFLRDGEERVVDLFKQFKKQFPGRYFLLGEFDRVSDDKFRAISDYRERFPALQYQYIIHPLSLQGLPMPREKWIALLERAGVEIVGVKDHQRFRLITYVIRL